MKQSFKFCMDLRNLKGSSLEYRFGKKPLFLERMPVRIENVTVKSTYYFSLSDSVITSIILIEEQTISEMFTRWIIRQIHCGETTDLHPRYDDNKSSDEFDLVVSVEFV